MDVEKLSHFDEGFGTWMIWYEAESGEFEPRHGSVNFSELIRSTLRMRDDDHWAKIPRLAFDV